MAMLESFITIIILFMGGYLFVFKFAKKHTVSMSSLQKNKHLRAIQEQNLHNSIEQTRRMDFPAR